jgi:hypothetical protein
LFQGLVLLLGLAVGPPVECGQESVVNAHVGADWSPDSAGELRSAVGDDIVWSAMLADHVVEKHMFQFQGLDILSAA